MHRGAIAGHGFCRRRTQAITSIHAMTVHDRVATVDPSRYRRRLLRGLAGRDAGSMLASRSVQQGNHCAREEFLHELKAGPATTRRSPGNRPHPTCPGYAPSMALPALTHRGFWTRIVVFGASLLIFVGAMLVMVPERSPAGVALTCLLALLSLTRIIVTVIRRPARSPR
jgi:hypothetical protein